MHDHRVGGRRAGIVAVLGIVGSSRRSLAVVAAAIVVVAGCSSGEGKSSAPRAGPATTERAGPEPAVGTALFASGPCPQVVTATAPVTVSCGSVTVPERHNVPGGPKVVLPVAVLQPPGGATHPDPIVYLDGGPGGDGVSNAEQLSELPIARSRTVVVVGQRGSPLAKPSFDCPEIEKVAIGSYGRSLGTPEALAASKQALTACFQRVRAGSPAFDTYDSATAADDLEATRRALGYDTWNLYGVSYGTRLGLEVLRRHPGAVRSSVLDSMYPAEVDGYASLVPSAKRAFHQLADGCAAAPACAAAYPNLYDRVGKLYERLEANPVDSTVPHPVTGQPTTVRWDGDRTVQAAFQALYSTKIIPLLPSLLRSFENGQFDLATTTYLQLTEASSASVAEGLFDAVECRERAPFANRAALQRQVKEEPAWLVSAVNATTWAETALAECDHWRAPPAAAKVTQPVRSNVPTLVLAGQYDPITPPAWGRQVADTLDKAQFHEFPGYGHGASFQPCATDMVAAFFDDPTTDPVLPCLANLGPPAWVLPSQV